MEAVEIFSKSANPRQNFMDPPALLKYALEYVGVLVICYDYLCNVVDYSMLSVVIWNFQNVVTK